MNSHSFRYSPNANSYFQYKIITRDSFRFQGSSNINKWAMQISKHTLSTGNIFVHCLLLHAAQYTTISHQCPSSLSHQMYHPFSSTLTVPFEQHTRTFSETLHLLLLNNGHKVLYEVISSYTKKVQIFKIRSIQNSYICFQMIWLHACNN